MNKAAIIIISILFLTACTQHEASEKPADLTDHLVAKNNLDSVSYAIGQNVARILKGQGFDTLNYAIFSAAIEASLNGDSLWFTKAEANRYINLYVLEQVRELSAKNLAYATTWLDSISQMEGVRLVKPGVYYRIIKEGTGSKPLPTQEVEIDFQGLLPNGEVFDDSYERNQPVSFVVNSAVDGWQAVLPLLMEGSEAEIWLHPDMGYGTQGGYYGVIPANSALYYRMNFIRILPGNGY
jgi:FKBP-type peptidyl-prolyl cis-trans isomerase